MPSEDESREPGEYECEACGESFASEAELQRHARRVGLTE
jgi:CRISPR/Cas system-associated protein Cas10 (large subunit of type III CRISPR-Cas system)